MEMLFVCRISSSVVVYISVFEPAPKILILVQNKNSNFKLPPDEQSCQVWFKLTILYLEQIVLFVYLLSYRLQITNKCLN